MKVCSKCSELKPISQYARKGGGRIQAHCKACQNKHFKAYYHANRKAQLERVRKTGMAYAARVRTIIDSIKNKPCQDCNQRFPSYVMDFDHRDGSVKVCNVSQMYYRWRYSLDRIIKEIEKCDLVCANCHRIRTHARRNRWSPTLT